MCRHKVSIPEIKAHAVRMLIEAQPDYPSLWSAIQAIAPKIGCNPETLRSWHQKHLDSQIPEKVQAQSDKDNIYQILPITEQHLINLKDLPDIHRDPFDRMIISQAMTEKISLLSYDKAVQQYPLTVLS